VAQTLSLLRRDSSRRRAASTRPSTSAGSVGAPPNGTIYHYPLPNPEWRVVDPSSERTFDQLCKQACISPNRVILEYSADMFERYTEKARRTTFFARYEASQFGGSYIETEHLLLGLFREDKVLASQVLASYANLEAIRHSIAERTKTGVKIATSIDMPLSQESKHVLDLAAEESERMDHEHIGTPHLLPGLLREEESLAAQLLREQGLTVDSVREQARQSESPPAPGGSASIAGLSKWVAEREATGGNWIVEQKLVGNRTTHFAIYAGDPPKENVKGEDTAPTEKLRQPPPRTPLLCIEILRDDRFSDVQKRCDDYLAEGVAQVWLLDPVFKRAYTVTKTDGLREFKGEILRVANPPLEMDLRKIFE
jgi:hypothetical protein